MLRPLTGFRAGLRPGRGRSCSASCSWRTRPEAVQLRFAGHHRRVRHDGRAAAGGVRRIRLGRRAGSARPAHLGAATTIASASGARHDRRLDHHRLVRQRVRGDPRLRAGGLDLRRRAGCCSSPGPAGTAFDHLLLPSARPPPPPDADSVVASASGPSPLGSARLDQPPPRPPPSPSSSTSPRGRRGDSRVGQHDRLALVEARSTWVCRRRSRRPGTHPQRLPSGPGVHESLAALPQDPLFGTTRRCQRVTSTPTSAVSPSRSRGSLW